MIINTGDRVTWTDDAGATRTGTVRRFERTYQGTQGHDAYVEPDEGGKWCSVPIGSLTPIPPPPAPRIALVFCILGDLTPNRGTVVGFLPPGPRDIQIRSDQDVIHRPASEAPQIGERVWRTSWAGPQEGAS